MRARLEERGVDAQVDSAGLLAEADSPSEGLVAILRNWDVDLGTHVSRRLTTDAIESADLVITMEHFQVAEVAQVVPEAWTRTFTLREVTRRAERIGVRGRNEQFVEWRARLGAGRMRTDLVGAWHVDIADPIGQGATGIERTADEIDHLVRRFADLAWPRPRGGRRTGKR
jgi:protein-tyrosine-phosphatase